MSSIKKFSVADSELVLKHIIRTLDPSFTQYDALPVRTPLTHDDGSEVCSEFFVHTLRDLNGSTSFCIAVSILDGLIYKILPGISALGRLKIPAKTSNNYSGDDHLGNAFSKSIFNHYSFSEAAIVRKKSSAPGYAADLLFTSDDTIFICEPTEPIKTIFKTIKNISDDDYKDSFLELRFMGPSSFFYIYISSITRTIFYSNRSVGYSEVAGAINNQQGIDYMLPSSEEVENDEDFEESEEDVEADNGSNGSTLEFGMSDSNMVAYFNNARNLINSEKKSEDSEDKIPFNDMEIPNEYNEFDEDDEDIEDWDDAEEDSQDDEFDAFDEDEEYIPFKTILENLDVLESKVCADDALPHPDDVDVPLEKKAVITARKRAAEIAAGVSANINTMLYLMQSMKK